MRYSLISLMVLTCSAAMAETVKGPVDVRTTQQGKLVSGPTPERDGDQIRIRFAVDVPTDVEVAILDLEGKVVRHLAAGLLGKNAPEPFRKDSLSQEIEWDMLDDAGKAATGGPFTVRVRVGAGPKLERLLGWDGNCLLGKIVSLRMSPRGELFVLLANPFRGRAEMRVLDSDGKYLRTIIPYPADTPKKRTAPVGHIEIDGRCQPVVFNGQGHSIYPLTAGLREQTMAWHPDGFLILASAVGSMCNHGPSRFLMALHPEGGSPEGVAHIGPQIRDAGGFMGGAGEPYAMGLDRIAVSPDGEWMYFVQNFTDSYRFAKELRHGVYRLKWSQAKAEELWVGQDAAGSGDDEFNEPAGIAVDGQGRLFICDRGNNRVKVLASDGTLLDQFPCPQPEQIELHPKSGEIVVLSKENNRRTESGKLFHFSAWKKGATKKLAEQEVSGLRCMTRVHVLVCTPTERAMVDHDMMRSAFVIGDADRIAAASLLPCRSAPNPKTANDDVACRNLHDRSIKSRIRFEHDPVSRCRLPGNRDERLTDHDG